MDGKMQHTMIHIINYKSCDKYNNHHIDRQADTVKPVCNDHLYDKIHYLRFIR